MPLDCDKGKDIQPTHARPPDDWLYAVALLAGSSGRPFECIFSENDKKNE